MPDSDDRERKIRERAYELWQQAGSPEGQHEEFWRQAEAEEHGNADADSFPASDPPSNTGVTGPGRKAGRK